MINQWSKNKRYKRKMEEMRLKEIRKNERKSHIEIYSNAELYKEGSWLIRPIKTVVDLIPLFDKYEEIYQKLMEKTFKKLNIKKDYEVDVNLIDNERIHEINREYRHVDRPTDVISFAFLDHVDGEVTIKGDIPTLLGEIFISVDKAKEQANAYGHSLLREMSFLFVHGLLHLLGYDHMTKEEETVMFSLQEEILKED